LLYLYTTKTTNFRNLIDDEFASDNLSERDEVVFKPCTSLGEAALTSPGDNNSLRLLADWHDTFYYGLEDIAWFACNMANNFSIPLTSALRILWLILIHQPSRILYSFLNRSSSA
jgi:hypothetical protein